MFLINAAATVVAVLFVLAIFLWLERRGLEAAWGDVRMGIWLALTRAGLMRLKKQVDPRNWRPHLLVLTGAPMRRWHLVELATSFTHDRGILTVATVLGSDSVTLERKQNLEAGIQDFLSKRGVGALVRVISAPDPFAGSEQLVETYGLGTLVPNTILLGDTKEDRAQGALLPDGGEVLLSRSGTSSSSGTTRQRGFGDRKTHRHLVGWASGQRRPDAHSGLPAPEQPPVAGRPGSTEDGGPG